MMSMLKLMKMLCDKVTSKKEDTSTKEVVDPDPVQDVELVPNKVDLLKKIDLKDVGDPIVLNSKGNKTLLVVNDIPTTLKLLEMDFKTIETEYCKDIMNTYKIVICSGRYANLIAYKYLLNNHIDKALLDLILSDSIIKMEDDYIEFTGFDIAEEIKKRNSQSEVGLYTSVPLNEPMGMFSKYMQMFKMLTSNKIIDKYININLSNRTAQLNTMF